MEINTMKTQRTTSLVSRLGGSKSGRYLEHISGLLTCQSYLFADK